MHRKLHLISAVFAVIVCASATLAYSDSAGGGGLFTELQPAGGGDVDNAQAAVGQPPGQHAAAEVFHSREELLDEAARRLEHVHSAQRRARQGSIYSGGPSARRARLLFQQSQAQPQLSDFARPNCTALQLQDPILPCAEPQCAQFFEIRAIPKSAAPAPTPLPPAGAAGGGGGGATGALVMAPLPPGPPVAAPPNVICAQIAPVPRTGFPPVPNSVQRLPPLRVRTVVVPAVNFSPDVPYDYDYAFSFNGDNVLTGASGQAQLSAGARLTTREGNVGAEATGDLSASAAGVLGPFAGARANLNGGLGADAALTVVQDPATPLTLEARARGQLGGQAAGGLYLFPGSTVSQRRPRGGDEDRVAFPTSNLRRFGLLPRR